MARNRRVRNQNPTPQTGCFAMCEYLEDSEGGFCQSGVYQCGSGPGGNCQCTNMGPIPLGNAYLIAPGVGQQQELCQYSCFNWNANSNYHSCLSNCFSSTISQPINRGVGTGRNFRRGGRPRRRFQQGGHTQGSPNSCMDGMGNNIPCGTGRY